MRSICKSLLLIATTFILFGSRSSGVLAAQAVERQIAGAKVLLQARGTQLLDQNDKPIRLRCVNLSPWLERQPYLLRKNFVALFRSPSELEERLAQLVGPIKSAKFWSRWESDYITEDDFKIIRRQGFNCVRLPLNYGKLASVNNDLPFTFNPESLAQVDRALMMGARNQLMVIISLISAPGGQNNLSTVADLPSSDTTPRLWIGATAALNQDLLIHFWQKFALRYAGRPGLAGYDLLNEPNLPAGVSTQNLPLLYHRIVSAVRQSDSTTLIILQGGRYAVDPVFVGFRMIQDNNIAYSFHAYNWFNPLWAFPNESSISPYCRIARSHNVPIWLGEFGEDRMNWISTVISLSERMHIGWALWPWKRVDLGNDRPAIQTIKTSKSWNKLMDYLIGSPFAAKPSLEQTEVAFDEMLFSIQTVNTIENTTLVKAINDAAINKSDCYEYCCRAECFVGGIVR